MKRAFFLIVFLFSLPYLGHGQIDSTLAKALEAQKAVVSITATRQGKADESGKVAIHHQRGAGVILDPSGLIVTNLHTLYQMTRISVQLHNDQRAFAQIVELFPQFDLALIKINSSAPLTPIELSDCRDIHLGQEIINAGHSKWLNNTLSSGKIIGLGKNKVNNHLDVFQVNVNLYEGDSGGPVLNNQGQLLGIMMGKRTDRKKASIAIPATKIKQLYVNYLNK